MLKIVSVVCFTFLVTGCGRFEPKIQSQSEDIRQHFTIDDLKTLNCDVSTPPKIILTDIPFISHIEAYTVQSQSPCQVKLVSKVSKISGDGDSQWNTSERFRDKFAERLGYTTEKYAGNLGDYSQIEIYTQQGNYKGFAYSVEANKKLHEVQILNENIEPNQDFEAVLKQKL